MSLSLPRCPLCFEVVDGLEEMQGGDADKKTFEEYPFDGKKTFHCGVNKVYRTSLFQLARDSQ